MSWRTAVAQSCLQGSQSTTPSRSPSTSSISSTSTSSVAQGCGKPSGPCDREACALAQPCNPRVPALLTCLCSRIDRAQAVVACILSILGTMNISTGLEARQAACTAQALSFGDTEMPRLSAEQVRLAPGASQNVRFPAAPSLSDAREGRRDFFFSSMGASQGGGNWVLVFFSYFFLATVSHKQPRFSQR